MSMREQASSMPPGRSDHSDDERAIAAGGMAAILATFVQRVHGGDLVHLPIMAGLLVIWTVFGCLDPVFFSADNLANLLFDSATTGIIALGIVCVLMLGQIDLSVGSVSGFASALVGVLWVNHGWPVMAAIAVALLMGGLVGVVYGVLFNRIGMPSFVATLAGLLAILGLQLHVLGPSGAIRLPHGSLLLEFGQTMMIAPTWLYLLALAPGILILLAGLRMRARRRAGNLPTRPVVMLAMRAVGVTLLLVAAVAYLGKTRGVPLMFGLFIALAAMMDYAFKRTRWGRSIRAVGDNREAARRAGINVDMIVVSAFMLCAAFAALGGVMTAARLAAASQQTGTIDVNLNAIAAAVIGGTSMFGGRGNAYSAVLGIVVIQSIASGLTLLDLPSSLRLMITGAVLATAVVADSLARRSRVLSGLA